MKKSTHTAEYRKLREELVQARSEAQLSQRDLATILRVAPSWVAKVETGERRIDLVEFCWFLAACKANPSASLERIASVAKIAKGGRSS
jgi:transcriptional regulator with XRE-family HTH domain